MNRLCSLGCAFGAFALAGAACAMAAEPFPSQPIRVIVTAAPGGLTDITARLIARHMGDKLGQPVVVENRVGAGGLIAIRAVKNAPADGYTLLATLNTVVIQQWVSEDPGYDLVRDFVGIGMMTRSPFVVVAAPSQPDRNMADLLARARANPGTLAYASAGNGSTSHIAAALLAQRAGLSLLHVPYKGNAAALPDVIAGRVGINFEGYGSGVAKLRDGRLKALGVTSIRRLDVLPDVPTVAEQGVPNYSFYIWAGLLAPAATPKAVVQTLSGALRAALGVAEVKNRFRSEGSEVMPISPEEFNQSLKEESGAMSKLVSDLALPRQ